MNDFNNECENCWCYFCKNNSLGSGECQNCNKCSGDNSDSGCKYLNDKWKMNCSEYIEG